MAHFLYRRASDTFIRLLSLIIISLVPVNICLAAGEEQAAEPVTDEQREYFVEDIKDTMTKYIAASVNEHGVFHLRDEKTGKELALKFVQIHDPVRKIGSDVYFACTDFHVVGEPDKLYDLDFWMNDKTGKLQVFQSKVHKEPRKSMLYG